MINKGWLNLISKYSFIEKVEKKGLYVYFYYISDKKLKHKKISIRATGNQVQRILENLKNEINIGTYGKSKFSDYMII